MQKPPKNETYSTFQRKTLDGRILEYRLNVIQEPEKARACGSGPRSSSDRRPVDPPPVVSLTIHDGNQDITMQYESSLYLYASLEFARPIARSHMQEPSHKYPVLTGACVTGAAYLQKPQLAAYFIFSDMSVRHEGFYRLRFHLLEQVKNPNDEDLEPAADNPMVTARPTGDILQNRTFVYSKPFQVFSAKKFPGLSQSTALSMELQAQGCRVRIRRDVRQRRQTTKKGMDDDDSLSVHGTPRALSHERSASRESLDRRPIPADYSRRPSLEAHTPISYIPSRNQSRDFGPLPSPTSAGGFQQLPRTTLPPLSGSSMPAPAPYSQSYSQSRPMQMPPPPPRLNVSPATDAMRQLPSLQSLGPAPPPRGSYHPTSLLSKRSHSSYAYEPRNPLKDRARPDTVPERRTTVEFLMNPIAPLSNGTDRIEADDDDAPDSSDHEIDPFMIRTYRRADGTKASVGHVLNR